MVDYELLSKQVDGLLEGERDPIANASNFAAFIYQEIPRINWAGFYFLDRDGSLVLGPFGGRPACGRLAPGRGVCGAAVTARATLVVDDVNAFTDHIACDTASESEIVVPLIVNGEVTGVFDVDAPVKARFDDADKAGIERLVARYLASIDALHFLSVLRVNR